MKLSSIPGLSPSTLRTLHDARITTVGHLLAQPPWELARLSSLSEQEANLAFATLAKHLGAHVQPVLHPPPPPSHLTTGVPSLDTALGGGIRSNFIAEFAGPSGAGTTQLALTTAAATLAAGSGIIWVCIGSGCGQVTRRLRTMLSTRIGLDAATSAIRTRAIFLDAKDSTEAAEAAAALRDDILAARALRGADLPGAAAIADAMLVVFDAPAVAIAPLLTLRAADGWGGRAAAAQFAGAVRTLAADVHVAVVLTGPVSSGPTAGPALGRAWAHVPDVRVVLFRNCEIRGCSRDVGDVGGVVRRLCHHIEARVSRKDGRASVVQLAVVLSGVIDVEAVT